MIPLLSGGLVSLFHVLFLGLLNMKNPLDSMMGTVITGFVLTGVLCFVVSVLV